MLHIFQFLPNQTNFREKPVSFSKNTPKVAQNDFYDHLDHSKSKNFGATGPTAKALATSHLRLSPPES